MSPALRVRSQGLASDAAASRSTLARSTRTKHPHIDHPPGDNVVPGPSGRAPWPNADNFMKVRSPCGLALVCEISINHLAYKVFESYVVMPVELRASLGAISK